MEHLALLSSSESTQLQRALGQKVWVTQSTHISAIKREENILLSVGKQHKSIFYIESIASLIFYIGISVWPKSLDSIRAYASQKTMVWAKSEVEGVKQMG